MKKHCFLAALIAVTAGQIHAAQVVERSKDHRRLSELRVIQPANGQGQKAARQAAPVNPPANNPAQIRRK